MPKTAILEAGCGGQPLAKLVVVGTQHAATLSLDQVVKNRLL